LIFYPVIARLYTRAEFGFLAFLLSINNIITQISGGKYESSIVYPEKAEQANHLFNMGLRISILVSIVIPVLLFITSIIGLDVKITSEKYLWLYSLTFTVFFSTFALLLNGWGIRFKLFKTIIGYTLVLNISTTLIRLFLGFLNISEGLIISFLFGQVLASFYFFFAIRAKNNPKFYPFSNQIIETSKAYINFPKYLMLVSLVNSISMNLPIFALKGYFNEYLTGQFSIALTVLFKPILIYSNSVQQVLTQKLTEMKKKKSLLWPFINNYIKKIFLSSVIPAIILILIAPYLVNFFLGKNWIEAGKFCQIMIPWAFFVFLGSSLSFIPNLFNQQAKSLIIDLIYLILRLFALTIGIFYNNVFLGIFLFSIMGVLVIGYQLLWYRKMLINSDKSI
jgi:O-antigen/teichoic acid export membrane protein